MKSGIVILSELRGPVAERIHALQQRFDPKLARALPAHVTLTGSSGMGPISGRTTVAELRRALGPVALDSAPMTLALGKPIRFMQSNIVVLPLDPHGPLRALHDRIGRAGLLAERPKFTFTPHVTLSFFRDLPAATLRELMAVRIDDPIVIDRISAHRTVAGIGSEKLLELRLTRSKTVEPA